MRKRAVPPLLLAAAAIVAAGCSHNSAPVMTDRVQAIVRSTGGDWNKLTPADRDYMITKVGRGSPVSARMTFMARAGMLAPAGRVHH